MCTFLALETFSTKKCGCFWQVRFTTELFFNINHSSQRKQRDKQKPQPPSAQAQPSHRNPQGLTCPLCAPWPTERAAARQATGRLAGRQANGSSRVHIQYPLIPGVDLH